MKCKLMEICQQLKYLTKEQLDKGLLSNYIQDYAYILHDKDKREDGSLKEPHYHIMIRLKDSTDSKYISKVFDVEEQYINKVKGKWVDVLLYLTHKNALDKFQYDDSRVVSNFDFVKVRDEELSKKNNNNRWNEICKLIDDGALKRYNYSEFINIEEYVKYERKMELAFKYRMNKMRGVNRMMECVFITGESGCGKTTYAKEIAKNKEYSIYVSSGSNDVLDSYSGEDCLILDDLRPSCLGLSDLLKMLDNNTSSTVKSRYYNKVLECKMIIITTVLSIDNFFNNVFEKENEPMVQLKRRCKTYISMDCDNMEVSVYNSKDRDYKLVAVYENPIKYNVAQEEEDNINYIQNLLGGAISGLKKVDNEDDFISVSQEEVPF